MEWYRKDRFQILASFSIQALSWMAWLVSTLFFEKNNVRGTPIGLGRFWRGFRAVWATQKSSSLYEVFSINIRIRNSISRGNLMLFETKRLDCVGKSSLSAEEKSKEANCIIAKLPECSGQQNIIRQKGIYRGWLFWIETKKWDPRNIEP